MLKKCVTCKVEQSIDCFSKDKTRKSGFCIKCKSCMKTYRKVNRDKLSLQDKEYKSTRKSHISSISRIYYISNSGSFKEYSRIWSNTPIGKASSKNKQSKRRSVLKRGSVTNDELLQLEKNATHCFYCNIDLTRTVKHIDHFVPLSKGGEHELTNLVVSCPTCNLRKGAKDPFEFIKIIYKEVI